MTKVVWTTPVRVRIKSSGRLGTLEMVAYGAIVTEQGGDDNKLWVRLDQDGGPDAGKLITLPGLDVERVKSGEGSAQ